MITITKIDDHTANFNEVVTNTTDTPVSYEEQERKITAWQARLVELTTQKAASIASYDAQIANATNQIIAEQDALNEMIALAITATPPTEEPLE